MSNSLNSFSQLLAAQSAAAAGKSASTASRPAGSTCQIPVTARVVRQNPVLGVSSVDVRPGNPIRSDNLPPAGVVSTPAAPPPPAPATPRPATPSAAAPAAPAAPATPASGTGKVSATPAAGDTPPTPSDPVSLLSAALTQAGIDPGTLNLSYSEQVVGYPGGSYVDRQITAHFPNGKTERYDAGLVAKNPVVAVNEIGMMLQSHG